MRNDDTTMGGSERAFPSTLWSQVAKAGDAENPAARDSLERLIARYWKPAFCYICVLRGRGAEDAKDLTQDFFARLLERGHLGRLSPERGSFRGFLKRSMKNFVTDAARREIVRRLPGHPLPGSPEECAELAGRLEPDVDPERLFDREWNRELLHASLAEMEDRLNRAGLQNWYEIFREYCLPPGKEASLADSRSAWSAGEGGAASYRTLAEKFGISPGTVGKRIAYCIQELRAIAREKIRDYVAEEEDVDPEFREVMEE